MKKGASMAILLLCVLFGCGTIDPASNQNWCADGDPPVVIGGTRDEVRVAFRMTVIESSDASLVGTVVEDSVGSGYGGPWTIKTTGPSIFVYVGPTAEVHGLARETPDLLLGQEHVTGVPADGQLVPFGHDYTYLWLGVSELTEEGDPRRMVGRLELYWGTEERHVLELESTEIWGVTYCSRAYEIWGPL